MPEVKIESSYLKNNIGKTIFDTVVKYKPEVVVDFGVLYGYSTICMALALKQIGAGHISSCDIYDDYPYKHSTQNVAQKNIDKYGVADFVTLKKMNFLEWIEHPTHFDLMHLDISNDGYIIERAYNKLKHLINQGSVIIFEGGSEERDREEWVSKYHKRQIYPLKDKIKYDIINPNWPSLSMIRKGND